MRHVEFVVHSSGCRLTGDRGLLYIRIVRYVQSIHTGEDIAMASKALTPPHWVIVKRSELRQNQRATLKKAKGRTVVLISANEAEEERLLVDRKYFDEIVRKLRAAAETLAIMTDVKLFSQIMAAAKTLDEDMRLGKLHSFEEAFGED